MADRIPTTHAGSLPRPDELADMVWARMDGEDVDQGELEARIGQAVAELVAKQREVGLDVISDGEMSKPGFSSYVADRFSGFGGTSEFQSDDVAPFPELAMKLFANPQTAHLGFSNCVGPVELTDKDAVHRDIARFKTCARRCGSVERVHGHDQPRPDRVQLSRPALRFARDSTWRRAPTRSRYEYRAIVDAGFNLQIDSPDMAMAAHARSVGSSVGDWHHHLPLAVEALNAALDGIPPERIRFHVCWGNTGTPHHLDVPLADIIDHVLKVNAGTIYVEGANPRHAHEWRVFRDVELPDDKSVILGVIDVKSNYVEHPRLVADRLVQVGQFVGKDRLMAGTDCGFGTFIRWSLVDPGVMWLKMGSLVEGAEIASAEF